MKVSRIYNSKAKNFQNFIRYYKEESGIKEIDMHKVAAFALTKGFKLPPAISGLDRLAREFSRYAREEIRRDKKTGRPYRANHAYTVRQGDKNYTLWVDIDEALRPSMEKSIYLRREQMVGDAVQMAFDLEHWNSIHPNEQPLTVDLNFEEDVEWRKNAPDEDKEAS